MKIAIIGGGSTYAPEVVEGFIHRAHALGLTEVVFQDVDDERQGFVAGFCRRMVEHAGTPFRLRATGDLADAVDGATFVLTQFRVGGQEARHQDIQLGLRHGLIGQETTGVGGFAKALRTIPVILGIAREVERRAPEAWVINFTNPSGMVTEALTRHSSCKTIGLCNVPIEMKMGLAAVLGVGEERIRLDYVGLNHLAWIRHVWLDGVDVTATLIERAFDVEKPANIPDMDYDPVLVRALGMIPLYYDRFFYYPTRMLAYLKGRPKDRAEEVLEIERELLAMYRDPATPPVKPKQLELRGGAYYSKVAVEVIDAIVHDRGDEHIVNVPNRGAVEGFPRESVMEIPCALSSKGAEPRRVGALEPEIRGLIHAVKAYEELGIAAAVHRDYNKAFLALLAHPLGPKGEEAEAVLDDLLATNGLTFTGKNRPLA
ncbi:MAG: 6-phospho-beta-glucosidase [Myxococcales bacterium]|nr:6-phospho-beta-glucosidase [Myxococcales bacterium]